jgi:hypothetical protein
MIDFKKRLTKEPQNGTGVFVDVFNSNGEKLFDTEIELMEGSDGRKIVKIYGYAEYHTVQLLDHAEKRSCLLCIDAGRDRYVFLGKIIKFINGI